MGYFSLKLSNTNIETLQMISCLLFPPVYQETESTDAILKTIDNLKLEDDPAQTVNDKIEEGKTKKEIIC